MNPPTWAGRPGGGPVGLIVVALVRSLFVRERLLVLQEARSRGTSSFSRSSSRPGRVELPREIDRGVVQAEDPSNPEILVQLSATSSPSDYLNFYPSGEAWEPNV
jgi:hypothetical protein